MSKKIMDLIELAMKFTGETTVSVEFGGHINGVTVYGFNNGKAIYSKTCYLGNNNAEEKLNSMKKDLEKMLEQNRVD